MSKVRNLALASARNPARVILFILAVTLLIIGVSLGGPWYHPSEGLSSIAIALEEANIRAITGALFVIPSAAAIWGVSFDSRKWAYIGAFGLFLCYVWMAVFAAISFGFENAVWISRLALGLIAGVITLAERDQDGGE